MADYQPPTVEGDGSWFMLHSPDPYDQIVYSLPVPVDAYQKLVISATFYADTEVTAAFKLLLWLGQAQNRCVPGTAGFQAFTVGVADLGLDEATISGEKIILPDGIEYCRVAFEVDTCTVSTPGVTAEVYDLTLK